MTTIKRTLTFDDYLSYDDGTDDRYELIDGELVALPNVSGVTPAPRTNLCGIGELIEWAIATHWPKH